MSRTRIVQVTPTLGIGGAEQLVVHLTRHLDATCFEPFVVSLRAPLGTVLDEELRSAGVATRYLGKRDGFDVRTVLRLRRALLDIRPHVVHTHNNSLPYAYLAACGISPVVHTVHNIAEREVGRLARTFQHFAFRGGARPVAIGSAVAASIRRTYRLQPAATISNGIPVSHYALPATVGHKWRAENGVSPHAVVVVCVARFAPQKNMVGLVEAFAGVTPPQQGCQLLLAGDGPERPAVEALVAARGLANRIRILGRRSDVPELLSAADVFALSSMWEGNPLCVMEAMAAGRPVVSPAVGAIPEAVQDGETGILVPPRDVAALREAISRLVWSSEERRRMGVAAAARAFERFDVAQMASAYAALYREVAWAFTKKTRRARAG